MKTFAEYLPTLTAREREIVEAFHAATEAWHDDDNDWPLEIMRRTWPFVEPKTFEGESLSAGDKWTTFYFAAEPPNVKTGDRVRVVKMEETK